MRLGINTSYDNARDSGAETLVVVVCTWCWTAVKKLYQINTDKCNNMLQSHHFINTVHNSNMFRLLNGHLQGVQLTDTSSVCQQNGSTGVKFWKSNITYLQ
jgi:hypothetical protein